MPKTAIILFNLGGPDKRESIVPFLVNFFMDPNIIAAPYLVRLLIARWIAFNRSRKEAGSSYAALGYKSPLLENTEAQAEALSRELGPDYKLFIAMRYWHPFTMEAAKRVKAYDPDRIILLPLYPQYSTTTTRSSFQEWGKKAAAIGLQKPTQLLCCYPLDEGFIKASANNVAKSYKEMYAKTGQHPRVLFSAHGLPEKLIEEGDPYQDHCEQSAAAIAAATGIENLDWQICYQSRVGPLKWIGPSTSEAIHKAARDGKDILIYPHAFVSEHVETLVEIEIEYRHLAQKLGVKEFGRIPTVMTHPLFIQGLAAQVRKASAGTGFANARICDGRHKNCCQEQFRNCALWGVS